MFDSKSVPALLAALGLVTAALLLPSVAMAGRCETRAGSATGLTRDFAEYEALLIIKQVTGNWPIQSDTISQPQYRCKSDGVMWTCRAVAQVCKG
jgi:hypothetical protein